MNPSKPQTADRICQFPEIEDLASLHISAQNSLNKQYLAQDTTLQSLFRQFNSQKQQFAELEKKCALLEANEAKLLVEVEYLNTLASKKDEEYLTNISSLRGELQKTRQENNCLEKRLKEVFSELSRKSNNNQDSEKLKSELLSSQEALSVLRKTLEQERTEKLSLVSEISQLKGLFYEMKTKSSRRMLVSKGENFLSINSAATKSSVSKYCAPKMLSSKSSKDSTIVKTRQLSVETSADNSLRKQSSYKSYRGLSGERQPNKDCPKGMKEEQKTGNAGNSFSGSSRSKINQLPSVGISSKLLDLGTLGESSDREAYSNLGEKIDISLGKEKPSVKRIGLVSRSVMDDNRSDSLFQSGDMEEEEENPDQLMLEDSMNQQSLQKAVASHCRNY